MLKIVAGTSTQNGHFVDSATETEAEFSDGAGAFNRTPIINTGTTAWTAANPTLGVVVPETGIYRVSAACQFDAASDATVRRIKITVGGSAVTGGIAAHPAMNSASIDTFVHATTLLDLTAGNVLGMLLFQNSGGALSCTATITAEWVQSS
jgi:hypothetical protein